MSATKRNAVVLTEEQIEKQYSSSIDSVKLINEINLKENKTQEDLETIERNKEHLLSFLNRAYIKADNKDKTIFLQVLS